MTENPGMVALLAHYQAELNKLIVVYFRQGSLSESSIERAEWLQSKLGHRVIFFREKGFFKKAWEVS